MATIGLIILVYVVIGVFTCFVISLIDPTTSNDTILTTFCIWPIMLPLAAALGAAMWARSIRSKW